MADGNPDYLVVYEYTEAAGVYAGNRFRTPFASKEEFDQFELPENLKVVVEGVSDAESLRLCEEVPVRNKIDATLFEAGIGTEHFDPEYAGTMVRLMIQMS